VYRTEDEIGGAIISISEAYFNGEVRSSVRNNGGSASTEGMESVSEVFLTKDGIDVAGSLYISAEVHGVGDVIFYHSEVRERS